MTHAEFEMELIEALNMLLEDERASVEMEVALASGATEYAERETLSAMGIEDIHFCEQLRSEMELAGLPVSPQINGIVFQVIGAERYDDRLRAFAHHQRAVAEHVHELQQSNLEGAMREALEGIAQTHAAHTEWSERRAAAFAATRLLDFSVPRGQPTASVEQPDSASEPPLDREPSAEALAEAALSDAPDEMTMEPEPPLYTDGEDAPVSTVPVVTEPAHDETPIVAAPTRVRRATTPKARTKATSTAKPTSRAKSTASPTTRRTRQSSSETPAEE